MPSCADTSPPIQIYSLCNPRGLRQAKPAVIVAQACAQEARISLRQQPPPLGRRSATLCCRSARAPSARPHFTQGSRQSQGARRELHEVRILVQQWVRYGKFNSRPRHSRVCCQRACTDH